MLKKIEIKNTLNKFALNINDILFDSIGQIKCFELQKLLNSQQVIIKKFDHSLDDIDGCVSDYFSMLKDSIKSSYPLFDKFSNDLMRAAVNERIIDISSTDKRKITHAGVSDNYIQKLPSFDNATIDEILDIKKELSSPLKRYRSKMLTYSEEIQSMPWDTDFENECNLLYNKEITPALLDIEEATHENSFIKNFSKNILTDENFMKNTGGLVISIAAAGLLSSVSSTISSNTAILAGGAWAIDKLATSYKEYSEKQKEIKKKDLFFYYQAGKKLNK